MEKETRSQLEPIGRGVMKFNVDGTSRGDPSPAGIGGVLRIHESRKTIMFNESVGIKDSNEAEILSIKKLWPLGKSMGMVKL